MRICDVTVISMTYLKNHKDRAHLRLRDNCDVCGYKILAERIWMKQFEHDSCRLNEEFLDVYVRT